MAKTSLLQVRIDTELKQQAEKLFAEIGLDTPSAVRLFIKQSIMQKAIPFSAALHQEKNENTWDAASSYLNNPLHCGDTFRIFSKEELHER